MSFAVNATITLIVLSVFAVSYYISSNSQDLSFNGESEESVIDRYRIPDRSLVQVLTNYCVWPVVQQNKYRKSTARPLYCDKNVNFVSELDEHGYLTVHHHDSRRRTSTIRCSYSEILRNDTLGQPIWLKTSKSTLIEYFQFTVRCYEGTTTRERPVYERSFVNWAFVPERENEMKEKGEIPQRPSVSILMISSLSSLKWREMFPKSTEFLVDNDFITMDMYNKLTIGAAENARLVFTGRNENFTIFESMKGQGCSILTQDDTTTSGNSLFDGRLRGEVDVSPYLRYNYRSLRTPNGDGQCLKDGREMSTDFIENWRDSELRLKNKCHLSFNYLSDFIQRNTSRIGNADQILRTSLEQLKANGIFDSTIFVIMSDEGERQSANQISIDGSIEERNPFFSIRLPNSMRSKYRKQYLKLQENSKRLVTNLDLHETLMDLATLEIPYSEETLEPDSATLDPTTLVQVRGNSLLRQAFHKSITCADVGIPAQFCLCMDEDDDRAAAFSNDTVEYDDAFSLLEKYVFDLPCINQVERDSETYPTARVFTPNKLVRHGVNDLESWKNSRDGDANENIEFLRLGFTFESVPDLRGELLKGSGIGFIEYKRSSGEMTLIRPLLQTGTNRRCYTQSMDEVCEMCQSDFTIT